MNTTQIREEAIFSEALEVLDRSARDQLVAQRCEGDRDLHRRVSDLLALHDSDGCLLDQRATQWVGMADETVEMPALGSKLGNYQLTDELGSGGMGIVFRARQLQPVQREVAVKVIKLGMDTRSVIARFEAERQALALMDHPFITRVFDAGATDTGRPYFVMELVRGTAIHQFCDEHRLTLEQRLQLFIKVCRAIQHAHSRQVVHRDIKPSNILVTSDDGVPTPKIIDFGIAKATNREFTDSTLFTQFGQMVGTPLYMSPEQAEMRDGEIDNRSDIYSLGVLLYELITGEPPFAELREGGFQVIREAIQNREPQLASQMLARMDDSITGVFADRQSDARTLSREVKGELDWILMRCLAKSSSDRYSSAGDLARDIEHFLMGEPVTAGRPTLGHRLGKLLRRNRAMVAAAGVAVVALLISGLVLFFVGNQARQLAARVQQAELISKSALRQAEQDRARAAAAEERLAALEQAQPGYQFVLVNNAELEEIGDVAFSGIEWQSRPALSLQELYSQCQGQDNSRAVVHVIEQCESETGAPQRLDRVESNTRSIVFRKADSEEDTPSSFGATRLKHLTRIDVKEQMQLLKELDFGDDLELGHQLLIRGQSLLQRGQELAKQGFWMSAAECYDEAMTIFEALLEFDDPQVVRARLLLTECLLSMQDDPEAAGATIQSVVSGIECLVDQLPPDVVRLLSRVKSKARCILGREI